MSPRITFLAVAACLPLLARAADGEGDLRDLVAIHPPGTAAGRITFAGIGAGSSIAEFSAKFDNDRGFPRRFVADFGTELVVLSSITRDGRTGQVALLYSGSPDALRRVFDRWKAILVRAGAECVAGSCFWQKNDHGKMIATLLFDPSSATPEVHVTLED
jgi:hypothetical protein